MKKNTKIIIGAACAAAIMAGAGAGCYYRYTQHQAAAEEQTTEAQTETELETELESETEPETETQTEAERETETETETEGSEAETGTITSGVLPPSADYFIIADDADQFFEHSVFIGDSVMMGFRNFVMGQPQGFLGSPEFLVSGSFSVRMALNTISKDTIHPIYQGEQHYIWDSISMMEAEKAFLFFGLNDIGMEGVDGTCENYAAVIEKIKEINPDTEVYVISTTNMLTGSEKGSLNNENIRLLNEKMKAYCAASDTGYIDIASFLVGEDGGLRPELCSDEYVHQTYAAYEIWTKVLRGYASGGNYMLELETEAESEEGTAETEETVKTEETGETDVTDIQQQETTETESANQKEITNE